MLHVLKRAGLIKSKVTIIMFNLLKSNILEVFTEKAVYNLRCKENVWVQQKGVCVFQFG